MIRKMDWLQIPHGHDHAGIIMEGDTPVLLYSRIPFDYSDATRFVSCFECPRGSEMEHLVGQDSMWVYDHEYYKGCDVECEPRPEGFEFDDIWLEVDTLNQRELVHCILKEFLACSMADDLDQYEPVNGGDGDQCVVTVESGRINLYRPEMASSFDLSNKTTLPELLRVASIKLDANSI